MIVCHKLRTIQMTKLFAKWWGRHITRDRQDGWQWLLGYPKQGLDIVPIGRGMDQYLLGSQASGGDRRNPCNPVARTGGMVVGWITIAVLCKQEQRSLIHKKQNCLFPFFFPSSYYFYLFPSQQPGAPIMLDMLACPLLLVATTSSTCW